MCVSLWWLILLVVFVLLVVCPGAGSVDDMLDVENKRLAENLATKVSRLKSVSEDVGPAADLTSHSCCCC